jgi:hypothetical protein
MNAEPSGNDPTHPNSQEGGNGHSKIAPLLLLPISTIPTHQYSSAPSSYPRLSLPVASRSSHARDARNGYWKFNASWILPTKTSLLRTRTSTSCGGWSTASRTGLPKDFSRVLSGYLLLIYLSACFDCLCFLLGCFPSPDLLYPPDLLVCIRRPYVSLYIIVTNIGHTRPHRPIP